MDFSDLLHVPTREERLARFRSQPVPKWVLYPANYKEIGSILLDYGFPSTDYERVGDNVVISDGCICVVIKRDADRPPQTLVTYDNPLNPCIINEAEPKLWANGKVLREIERAQELYKQLKNQDK